MHVYIYENEIAIEGSVSELMGISEHIKRAKAGSVKTYDLSKHGTAKPYTALLEKLIINCNGSKIKGSLEGKSLMIEFSEETAYVMASHFEFEENCVNGCHYHLDQHGNEEYFETNSLEIVIQVSHKNS